jgi:hypothetical protein
MISDRAPLIWAWDLASTTGFARGRAGETPIVTSVKFSRPDDDEYQAFGRAVKFVFDQIRVERPDVAFIEAPYAGLSSSSDARGGTTNYATTKRLLGLVGAVGGLLQANNIAVRNASIQSVRKFFIGDPRCPGPEAKRRTRERCADLGWRVNNFDEADAAALWAYGVFRAAPRLAPITDPIFLKAMKGGRA